MSPDVETTTIPKIRRVFSDTYANLPTTGLRQGDLGYAIDRRVFYRWSGAAWEAITIHSSSGLAANIPAAADMPEGSLYFETDTKLLKQVQSAAWVTLTPTKTTFTELAGGQSHAVSSADTWEDYDISAIVPAGTTCVLVAIKGNSQGLSDAGVRKNGTALNRKFDLAKFQAAATDWVFILTEVDANRVIECFSETNVTFAYFNIVGYWS